MSSTIGPRSKLARGLLMLGGFVCVGLALAGILLPVLPTTPFLLLAAFLFARSSERFLNWLLNQRWLGGYIRAYRERRGMPAREKAITLAALWLSIVLTGVFVVDAWWGRLGLGLVALGVTWHLLRMKTCAPEPPVPSSQPGADPLVSLLGEEDLPS